MDVRACALEILTHLGGVANVMSVANCMTRLRVQVREAALVQKEELKALPAVLGLVEDETLQIVLGPGTAAKVAQEVADICKVNLQQVEDGPSVLADWKVTKEDIKKHENDFWLKRTLKRIAAIFIPMIPAIISAGLFSGLASLLGQCFPEAIQAKAGFVFALVTLFQLFSSAFLGYFVIFTGVNAAKEFGATPALGGMIGAISIGAQIETLSNMMGLFNAEVPLDSILRPGKGGIIGVIFGVWILAQVERALRRRIPDLLDLIVTPLLTVLVSGTAFVFIVMPVAGYVSDLLVSLLSMLIMSGHPVISVLTGYLLSAIFLPMVLLGLHHGLIPIYAVQLEQMGGVSLFPVLAMAGAGQVGAALAIYLKARRLHKVHLMKIITGALPAGLLGVGEPLIYGLTLPLGKPFISAGLGAGFGGAFVMLMGVQAIAWGPSGLVALPLMKTPSMILYYGLGLLIAYVGGFVTTSLMLKDEDLERIE